MYTICPILYREYKFIYINILIIYYGFGNVCQLFSMNL